MGLCNSAEMTPAQKEAERLERMRSRELERAMQEDNAHEEAINKLLLLGAGESGKSTLFKQMITIYGNGFPDEERKTFEFIIYNNIILSMQVLITASENPEYGQNAACSASAEAVKGMAHSEAINHTNVEHFKALWADAGIQFTYENRSQFQLTDSAKYFFDKMDEVAGESYLPTEQDVLRSRVRTTGIVENTFTIKKQIFKMFDVGGQRSERKKWIHCFEDVTAVLFVGVLSEYDQKLYEDDTMNRMEETLTLFEEICNSRWFCDTPIILFLNKRDLFEEKIKKVPLNVCPVFAEYTGPNTYDLCSELIEQEFLSKKCKPETEVYPHLTCATDTTNIAFIFNMVKDIIIRRNLKDAKLV